MAGEPVILNNRKGLNPGYRFGLDILRYLCLFRVFDCRGRFLGCFEKSIGLHTPTFTRSGAKDGVPGWLLGKSGNGWVGEESYGYGKCSAGYTNQRVGDGRG